MSSSYGQKRKSVYDGYSITSAGHVLKDTVKTYKKQAQSQIIFKFVQIFPGVADYRKSLQRLSVHLNNETQKTVTNTPKKSKVLLGRVYCDATMQIIQRA